MQAKKWGGMQATGNTMHIHPIRTIIVSRFDSDTAELRSLSPQNHSLITHEIVQLEID